MSEKTAGRILAALRKDPASTIRSIAQTVSVTTRTVERNLKTLQSRSLLRRVGPDKGGHWEVVEKPAG
jgi:ATP-dependent DNA helicase RecG